MVMLFGSIVALVLAFWPVTLHVLGTDVDCGTGPLAAMRTDSGTSTSLEISLAEQCRSRGRARLLYGAGVLIITVIAYSVVSDRGRPSEPRLAPPPPGWWWDGYQWRPPTQERSGWYTPGPGDWRPPPPGPATPPPPPPPGTAPQPGPGWRWDGQQWQPPPAPRWD